MKNAKMKDFEERVDAVYPSTVVVRREKIEKDDRFHLYLRGYVEHKLGLITFYQSLDQGNNREYLYLRLSLIHGGKNYSRTWQAYYREKTIARLANEFIEDCWTKMGRE